MSKRKLLIGILAMGSVLLAGCGKSESDTLAEIPRTIYQKSEYQTIQTTRGDMEPKLILTLKPQDVEKINYTVNEGNLEVEDIYVSVGDEVKAGQTLISFKSDDLKKSIEKYSNEVVKKQLLLDHYNRMYNVDLVDKDEKYSVILQELADDVELAKLYLAEEQQKYAECQIVAQKDGIVSYISKSVMSGYVDPEQTLLTESCGRNLFAANTKDMFEFNIGDEYTAEYKEDIYPMKVVDIVDESDFSRTIVFEAVGVTLNIPTSDTMEMVINKPQLANVVYVDKAAINKKNDETFVYVVKEDGFLEAVYVEVGEEVNGMVAILSGLEGTEEVAIR